MTQLSRSFEHKVDENGQDYIEVSLTGMALLRLTATNKGTAFTQQEREELGLDGLLPPQVVDLAHQVERLYRGFLRQTTDIDKYQYLRATQERSEVAFYALLIEHIEEMMPIVYTPTVGFAIQDYSNLYQTPRGITISSYNVNNMDQVLANYPWHDVRMIVATDSSAILGIGDQGNGGIGISIGKLALYTAGGGVNPFHTLPMNFDVGTNRQELLDDPSYLGVHEKRLSGDVYFEMVEKFVVAVKKRWPKAIIQWEDFAKDVAFEVLERYQDKLPSFNDDIQGTGAVVLSGLLSACELKGESIADQRIVIVGAGAGGVGVAKMILEGMVREGLSLQQARQQMFVMDGRGLVVDGFNRDAYKAAVSQSPEIYANWDVAGDVPNLSEVVSQAKPTILLGLTGIGGLFDQSLIETMAEHNERPIIFPLSNPTANCEALPEDIFHWSKGQAIIATGSPFADVEFAGEKHPIGQGNNAFVFPGLGFAAIIGECTRISNEMVLESAYALADYTKANFLQEGRIFPPIRALQGATAMVTERVLLIALDEGSASINRPDNVAEFIAKQIWKAEYLPFRKKV